MVLRPRAREEVTHSHTHTYVYIYTYTHSNFDLIDATHQYVVASTQPLHNLPSQPIEIYQDQISAGTSANQEACWGMAESGRFRGLKAQRSSRASPPPRSAGASRRGEGRLHAARGLLDHEALCMCTAKSLQAFALEVDTGLSLQRRRTHTAQGPKAQGLVGFQRSLTSEATLTVPRRLR